MTIFDDIHRTDEVPKKHSQSYFDYYNSSARNVAENIRKLLEEFITRYPGGEVEELVARIRSGDDDQFHSAVFELLLHELLKRQGCKLVPHPELTNGSKSRPDFLVTTPDGSEFYLEAVLANQKNEANAAAEAMKGLIYDALTEKPHHDFMVIIDETGDPTTQPSSKKLVQKVHNWLDTLDHENVRTQIQEGRFEDIDKFTWKHEDWNLELTPWALQAKRRGKSSRLIGAGAIKTGFVDDWTPMRNAIKNKGTKYGELDKPMLIAVNMLSSNLDRLDEMQALFGQEQFIFTTDPHNEPRFEREGNGAWMGKGGPQYTRVSGVWIFNDLRASTICTRTQTVYFNPWANIPIPDMLKIYPHAIPENDKMKWSDGLSLQKALDLPDSWPE